MPKLSLPHKTAPPQLKNSYYIIYALTVLVVAIVLVNVFGNAALRSDHTLEVAIENQQEAIQTYVSSHKALPDIISDAGISDTKGVEYKKISSSRYMLCATFKTKSDGYVPTAIPLDGTAELKADAGANTKFVNGDASGLKHEKGHTCIYYEPYNLQYNQYNLRNDPSYLYGTDDSNKTVAPVCGSGDKTYTQSISAKVTSVNTEKSRINLDTSSQLSNKGGVSARTETPISYFSYDKDTLFYGTNCKKIDPQDIALGQRTYFYIGSSPETPHLAAQVESINQGASIIKPDVNSN